MQVLPAIRSTLVQVSQGPAGLIWFLRGLDGPSRLFAATPNVNDNVN
jgi:hypothetical protein